MSRPSVLALMLVLASMGWPGGQTSIAHACSVGSFGTPERQLQALFEAIQPGDVVLVGDVLDERRLGKYEQHDVYTSRVTSLAQLAGDQRPDTLDVRTLSFDGSTCQSGPRLLEGERVLLVLDWKPAGSLVEGEAAEAWMLGHFLGKVRLDEREAVSQYANTGMLLGTPEDVIRQVAASVSARDEAIEAAIAALAAPTPAGSDAGGLSTAMIAGVAVLGLAAVSLAAMRLRGLVHSRR